MTPPPSNRLARMARPRTAASRKAPEGPGCGPFAMDPLSLRTAKRFYRAAAYPGLAAVCLTARGTLRGRGLRSKHDLVEFRLGVLAARSAAVQLLLALVDDALRVSLAVGIFAVSAVRTRH